MEFKVTAKVTGLVASDNIAGKWYLYRVLENGVKFDKTWTLFTRQMLSIDGQYKFSGTISESPSKKLKLDSGKAVYQTTYNAEVCEPVEASVTADIDFGAEPKFDDDSQIPF